MKKNLKRREFLKKAGVAGAAAVGASTLAAPTIPVEAASNIPTKITPIPKPPLTEPNKSPIESKSLAAIFVFSSITPIKINRGTATRASLIITP